MDVRHGCNLGGVTHTFKNRGGHIPALLTNAINRRRAPVPSALLPSRCDPQAKLSERGVARASLCDIILILLPRTGCGAREEDVEFMRAIFLINFHNFDMWARQSARQSVSLSCPLLNPSPTGFFLEARARKPGRVGVTSRYRRCTWNGTFFLPPILIPSNCIGYMPERNSGDFQGYSRDRFPRIFKKNKKIKNDNTNNDANEWFQTDIYAFSAIRHSRRFRITKFRGAEERVLKSLRIILPTHSRKFSNSHRSTI